MKYLFAILAFALAIAACKKNAGSSGNHLLAAYQPASIRVDQAIDIYDSTALSDSPRYFYPPQNRFYRWTISPADDAAVINGLYKYGRADIIFNHPGSFEVKADIYDSTNQHLLGHTDQIAVQVSSDTLHRTQPLQPGDRLIVKPSVLPYDKDTTTLILSFSTAQSYLTYGNSLSYNITYNNAYDIVFSDSSVLGIFPFCYGSPQQNPVTTSIFLGFVAPESDQFNITWLGKTYTGTISVDVNKHYSFNWDNSAPVQFQLQ